MPKFLFHLWYYFAFSASFLDLVGGILFFHTYKKMVKRSKHPGVKCHIAQDKKTTRLISYVFQTDVFFRYEK